MLTERIALIAGRECHLDKDRPLLLGVSGGADSLCLLELMVACGYKVIVAHFNHHLRAEAEADARFVQKVAETASLPFVLGSGEVAAFASQYGRSLEDAARELRYRFLFEQAHRFAAQAVAVGHTADDQVETVLMHVLRGSGLDGLTGMPFLSLPHTWDREIPLVRPLLTTWHSEAQALCAQKGRPPVEDITNTDTTYRRNRIRHDLLPQLEAYNPRIRQGILRMAGILAADRDLLDEVTGQAWQSVFLDSSVGCVTLNRVKLAAQSLAIQRTLLRKAIGLLLPSLEDVELGTIDRALDFVRSDNPHGRVDLVKGLQLVCEGNQALIVEEWTNLPSSAWPQMQLGASLAFELPGMMSLAPGLVLRAEFLSPGQVQPFTQADPFQAWLDADVLPPQVILRTRRPGDVFQPLGLEGKTQKLSDFFINVKCPARARAAWPLLCVGDQLAWVPGYRPAHSYRVTEGTRRVVHFQLSFEGIKLR